MRLTSLHIIRDVVKELVYFPIFLGDDGASIFCSLLGGWSMNIGTYWSC